MPTASMLDKYHGADFHPLYTAVVRVSGGAARHGRASGVVQSDDGKLDLKLRMPRELGGCGDGTNPEQLFAASYAACFHGALSLLAIRANVPIADHATALRAVAGGEPAQQIAFWRQ